MQATVYNHLGSTHVVTNKEGKLSQQIDYAPFGEVIYDSIRGQENDYVTDYLFNGKQYDEEWQSPREHPKKKINNSEQSGLYYYSQRYYGPPMFISPDPLQDEKPWLTPYHYCSNNPLNRVDPTGMSDGWVEDGNGNRSWNDKINSPEDFKNSGLPGKFLGNDFVDGNNYYTNEGHITPVQNLKPIEVTADRTPTYDDLNFVQKGLFNILVGLPTVLNFYFGDAPNNASDAEKLNSALPAISTTAAFMFIGGFKVNKESFHRNTKPDILNKAGKFEKIVGKNPNINVKAGNIILEGQGKFKGKTFPTGLKATDFLK